MSREKRKTKKKTSERSKQKHPNLKKQYNTKMRQDLLDQDYIHKLSDEEKEWLDRFNKEYVNASFEKTGDRHSKNNLHKGDKKRKEIYKENNKRRNCVYNIAKATKTLGSLDDMLNKSENENVEDALIEVIDAKNYVNNLKKPSLTKLAKSERKHSTMAKLRKKLNKTKKNSNNGAGDE